jgi:hypothetical protein
MALRLRAFGGLVLGRENTTRQLINTEPQHMDHILLNLIFLSRYLQDKTPRRHQLRTHLARGLGDFGRGRRISEIRQGIKVYVCPVVNEFLVPDHAKACI